MDNSEDPMSERTGNRTNRTQEQASQDKGKLDLRDRTCPVCGESGGGIVFYSDHWLTCKMEREQMQPVEDIEY